MTQTNMKKKNIRSSSEKQSDATIFVQIPSYRDKDCVRTVEDLFAKAKHPERIFIGICWQYKLEAGEEPLVFTQRKEQIRIINVDAGQSKGMSWAKHQAQSLWDGEAYILQIDSHTRFIQNWDEALLTELAACQSNKPVLSAPPPGFTLSKKINDNARPSYRAPVRFDQNGLLQLKSDFFTTLPEFPVKTAFAASRFMFASSELIKEVPNDPHIYLEEEEITLSARLWTHGWDIHTPGKVFVYHLYNSDGKQRPLHWRDNAGWTELRNISRQRYPYIMGLDAPKPHEAVNDLDKYGVGSIRPLTEYMNFCGIDFERRAPIQAAKECGFIKEMRNYTSVQDYWLKATDGKESRGKPLVRSAVNMNDKVVTAKVQKTIPAASPLNVGDFVPFFDLRDQNNSLRELQLYAGKNIVLFFLPAEDEPSIKKFFEALSERVEKYDMIGLQRAIIVSAPVKTLKVWQKKYNAPYTLWSDEDGAVRRLFSVAKEKKEIVSYLLDTNLKIAKCYSGIKAKDHVARPLVDSKKLLPTRKPKILTRHAPVMVIPNVISPALCQDIIHYWKTEGKQYEGTVGVGDNRQVKMHVKSRTDADVHDKALLARIDDAVVKSALPEIRKVGSTEIKYREIYKIGCYKSEKQGHYLQHRDTSALSLAHRRYSMSICLNDDYEGGGLNFPEYGTDIYKPELGSALIFPSTLMHKVEPVTEGKRFVMVSFLYGEDGAAFKCDYIKSQTQKAFLDDENRLLREIKLEGIKESKVYTQSMDQQGSAPLFQPKAPAIIGLSDNKPGVITPPSNRDLNVVTDGIPPGVLVIDNYLDKKSCRVFTDYADKMAGRPLEVVDNSVAGKGTTKTKRSDSRITDYVSIDGIVEQALPLFINIYDNILASYYGVNFEWFERPQILRYPPGGKYGQHADAEHYDKQQDAWIRAQDRDYSILVYLNEEYGGGELELNNFDFSIKPTTGMLLAFPSDHRYLHTARPTTSGLRYAMVSWAAAVGTPRVKERAPYAATFLKLKG